MPHDSGPPESTARNVLGGRLQPCCFDPLTGFFRDGFCHTHRSDHGLHTVCVVATEEFLDFSRSSGNDLSTPRPEFGFPGLRPGDRWCVCAARWAEAEAAGCAPPLILEACHEATLEVVPLQTLRGYRLQ